ncbi:MAG: transcriptional regulator, MerR family [Acidobacteriales bacterium]|nr:transcriptional regulator, MerR family [Terriglobales bacterium]
MPEQFTSEHVVALTGITPRQLQWWDERGIVVPAREGRNRLYSLDDLAEIAVVCQLRKKGFSLQRVRKIMRYLQRELGKRLVETVTAGSDYHLLTDGKRIYLENSANQVVDILKNARQPILAVCLSDAVREVHAEIRTRAAREFHAAASTKPRVRRSSGALKANLPQRRTNQIVSTKSARVISPPRGYVAKRRATS